MKYDLTRLGHAEFEHLAQDLGLAVLSNALSVFGDGPDGGREATFDGYCRYPDAAPLAEQWNGYGVLQAKFKSSPNGTTQDTDWFCTELRKELKTWDDPNSGRRQRGRLPNYLVLVTNVTLSPDPTRGGIDRANAIIGAYRNKLGLRGWTIWHQDQVCRYLEIHDGIRRTYAGMTTAGDVLAEVHRALTGLDQELIHREPLADLLTARAAKELLAQQWVRLSEAGHPANAKLMLSDVAVDLPARPSTSNPSTPTVGTVAHIIGLGDTIRRPRANIANPRHVTLIGGPGQGKTTLGQLICQVYRTAILEQRPRHTLGPEVPDLLVQYRKHLDSLALPQPRCRRWPVRVVLSEYADALAHDKSQPLLEYIAAQNRGISPINSTMMRRWLREWPWVLVLDGLDEVADPDIRELTLSRISEFYIDAARHEADLLVVATTRPQGYQSELAEKIYDHLVLEPMGTDDALTYARRLCDVRFIADSEMHDRVLARLHTAAADPHTRRLLRAPLQVTIMSILLERRARAPRERYGLFDAFYNTLYEREIGKDTPTAQFLEDHRRNVNHIHEHVGRTLHLRAQQAGESEARMPRTQLRDIALARLLSEATPADEAERLADRLATAATDRLVMIVGYSNDTIGFEVRSLQELMAARSLFAGAEHQVIEALRVLAQSSHWRNVWLFAASRVFAEREALRSDVLLVLDELNSRSPLFTQLLPGARVALEMLDEDIAAGHPSFRRILLQRSLQLLDVASPGETTTSLARVTHEAIVQEPGLTHTVTTVIDEKLTGSERAKANTLDFLAAWADLPGATTAQSRINRHTRHTLPHLESALKRLRSTTTRGAWARPPQPASLQPAPTLDSSYRQAMRQLATASSDVVPLLERLDHLAQPIPELSDHVTQQSLMQLLHALSDDQDWTSATAIQDMLLYRLSREPVPEQDLKEALSSPRDP